MKDAKDEHLLLTLGKGDLNALSELVTRHQRFVWGLAYRFLGDPAEAEDVAQEAFLRLLGAAPRYRPTANFRTYLYRIVSRLCIDYTRKKRPILIDDLPRRADCPPDPAATLVVKERDAEIRHAMDCLPPRQRMAVILKYYEGLSYSDIAQAMEITVKAVERLLARARKELNTSLAHLKEN